MNAVNQDIRIIVPAYNSDKTIVGCVDSIAKSIGSLQNCEIVVVDNGRNTDLNVLLKNRLVTILNRRKIASAAYSRNEGAKGFSKGIMVFIDCDVICEKDCIRKLIEPIQDGLCDATVGNYSKNLKGLSFSQKYKQLYINYTYSRKNTVIKNEFWTAISAIKSSVFNKLNGFDTSFGGATGEDQELGFRLTKNNNKVLSVNEASGQHMHSYNVKRIIRNDLVKGITAVKNSLNHKVSLSDNRHAGKSEMLSVAFSAFTLLFSFLTLFNSVFFFSALCFFALWIICRYMLIKFFRRNDDVLFALKSIVLMFVLDIIRFVCVLTATSSHLFKRRIKEELVLQPIHKYI